MAAIPPDSQLQELLAALEPVLMPGAYRFEELAADVPVPTDAIGWFREPDGLSVIRPEDLGSYAAAQPGFRAAWIALSVNSPLDSVGLTAAIATALARRSIPCNIVAAFRHDHLFVPVDRSEEALAILRSLTLFVP